MKRLFAVVLILATMMTMITACKPTPEVKVFCDWLTMNGFAADMGQAAFANHISTFYMNGKPLQEKGEFYNVTGGNGYSVGAELWGLTHEKTDKKTYNHFYIKANLDNLELPCGVMMGESKESCTEKLGMKGTLQDAKNIEVGRSTCEISFTDSILHFKEHYTYYSDSGKTVQVTRSLLFKFTSSKLSEFSVTVTETW